MRRVPQCPTCGNVTDEALEDLDAGLVETIHQTYCADILVLNDSEPDADQ